MPAQSSQTGHPRANQSLDRTRSPSLRAIQLQNCGDWNGAEAARAYLAGELDVYCRFIAQADRLWAAARAA